jgi:hypothetical protein
MANRTRRHANFATGNNIFVDATNGRVGVGTTVPSTTLQVLGTITCIDINSTSDIKLKENIHSIDNPLDKVMQINGVGFRWKDTKEDAIGVIAQNIEEVLPELVKENDQHKSVNYNGLIGLLVEAVKTQQEQINTLRQEIEELKK